MKRAFVLHGYLYLFFTIFVCATVATSPGNFLHP